MPRQFQSARYLDEPMRPLLGLSIVQGFGALLAACAAFGTWKGLGLLLPGGSFLTDLRIFAVAAVAVLLYFAIDALAGGRSEPIARQLCRYGRRPHRYASRPLLTTRLEEPHAPPPGATPARGPQPSIAAVPVPIRSGRARRR